MKKKNNIHYQFFWLSLLTVLTIIVSCKKQDDFLNVKSQKSDVTPTTLADFQAILDNNSAMNSNCSIAGLISSDNIYINDLNLNAVEPLTKNYYLWAKDLYQGAGAVDWNSPYQVAEEANIILDGLKNLPNDGTLAYNNVKGSALFYRAFAFYRLSQLFCKSYSTTANTDFGIPLRLSSDITIKSTRSTVEQTYAQITADLNAAVILLPQIPLYKTRPSSVAAYALLAKVYLAKRDYTNALAYSDLVLKNYNSLLDYNTIKQVSGNPFPSFAKGNPEIIFYAQSFGTAATTVGTSAKGRVDTGLIKSYLSGDLRKINFFIADGTTGLFRFKGSYTDNSYEFCGIGTDEIYLIHAECQARAGNINEALNDLNTLLKGRYTPSSYQPIAISDQKLLIKQILLERRKEMPFTGNTRWEDLRRLNLEPDYTSTIIRNSQGIKYTLLPNDELYVFPIPDPEIQLSGLIQNPR